jgi:hypothetical protein
MSRWFRLYSEAMDDPKVQRLSPTLFKTWVNILCLAASKDGRLPSIDDVAFRLRISSQDAEQQISDLILAGLIDLDAQKSMSPHNWKTRQYVSDDSKLRVRKYRAKKKKQECNGNVTVTVTPPEQNRTDSEADTDSEIDPTLESKSISNPALSAEEKKAENFNVRVGSGYWGKEPSAAAKQSVCRTLSVTDCGPILEKFLSWKPDKPSADVDAHFKASAPKILKNLPPEVRDRIAYDITLLIPQKPPARPSGALMGTLRRRVANV